MPKIQYDGYNIIKRQCEGLTSQLYNSILWIITKFIYHIFTSLAVSLRINVNVSERRLLTQLEYFAISSTKYSSVWVDLLVYLSIVFVFSKIGCIIDHCLSLKFPKFITLAYRQIIGFFPNILSFYCNVKNLFHSILPLLSLQLLVSSLLILFFISLLSLYYYYHLFLFCCYHHHYHYRYHHHLFLS